MFFLVSGCLWLLAAAVAIWVKDWHGQDSVQEITPELIRKHFKDAEIEPMFFGGWRVTMRNGSTIEIRQDGFKKMAGGNELYCAMVLLANDVWGRVTVFGPEEHILATMAHGECLGVNVIPEIRDEGDGCLKYLIGFVVATICGIIGACFWGIAGWFGVAIPVALITTQLVGKSMDRWARRRGQELRHRFPAVHGERGATYDDARKQGWI